MTKLAGVETLYHGWTKLLRLTFSEGDGTVIVREVEDHGGRSVCVLPYDPARRCALLISQFRAPVYFVERREELLEVIAGILEEEDIAVSARREAIEEAGLQLGPLQHVGCMWSLPGISTDRTDMFLAQYGESDRVGQGGGLAEEQERITVVEMPLAELASLADKGQLDDLRTFSLVQTLRLRHPELFA
jgi:nudix-type nucleoside diphosphatase (YffH/AdpP family)